jgi:hypothetical protein
VQRQPQGTKVSEGVQNKESQASDEATDVPFGDGQYGESVDQVHALCTWTLLGMGRGTCACARIGGA